MSTRDVYVGIDIAEDSLETALTVGDQVICERFTHVHDDAGLAALTEVLRKGSVKLVVVEPSGGLERDVVASLAAAGVPVVVINGRLIRSFARSMGLLAKTDKIDAGVIAIFAERMRPQGSAAPQRSGAGVGRTDHTAATGDRDDQHGALPSESCEAERVACDPRPHQLSHRRAQGHRSRDPAAHRDQRALAGRQ
jgi:transposase